VVVLGASADWGASSSRGTEGSASELDAAAVAGAAVDLAGSLGSLAVAAPFSPAADFAFTSSSFIAGLLPQDPMLQQSWAPSWYPCNLPGLFQASNNRPPVGRTRDRTADTWLPIACCDRNHKRTESGDCRRASTDYTYASNPDHFPLPSATKVIPGSYSRAASQRGAREQFERQL